MTGPGEDLLGLRVPVVAAPMAGGPSTPELVAAVGDAGGLGFLAAGYRSRDDLRALVDRTRSLTARPFGVNLFVAGPRADDAAALAAYGRRLTPLANRLGTRLGDPVWDDDGYAAKLDLLVELAVPLVSLTFGCPTGEDVARLHGVGTLVAVTVTSASEAVTAADRGADLVVAQGAQAGGHRGGFDPTAQDALALLPLLVAVRAAVDIPVIAAGGMMTGDDIAEALAAGAVAAALGTAFLLTPEAGTSQPHRQGLTDPRFDETTVTRAFTGRPARALVNAFVREHSEAAPAAYPQVHHLTRPLRAAAAAEGDLDHVHLWAGTGWRDARSLPAGELVATLGAELRSAAAARS